MRTNHTELSMRRAGERGAALITSLLVSMLMLAAGGALIITTGMTASNAVDSTAEAQAYYAAESGLQAALSVLRRNRKPAGAPASNFHNFLCGSDAACTNTGTSNLAAWLPPGADGRVTLSDNPLPKIQFSVTVRDPSKSIGDAVAANYVPRYLLVQSVGRGPKGATKVLEMMVDDFPFDFTARAAVAIRSNDTDSVGMAAFNLGNSQPHTWTGQDLANLMPPVPAFVVTNTKDYDAGDGFGPSTTQGMGEHAIAGDAGNIFGPAQLTKLAPSNLETWLQTAQNARAFLTEQRAKAAKAGRLNPGDLGTEDNPKFTFIDGDLAMGGSQVGAGLLIVTGNFSQGGTSDFKGVVLALGNGVVDRNGTPGALGALVVANFQHNLDASTGVYTGSGGFGSPSITSAGGGISLVGYNSDWVRKAMETLGATVVGVVER